MLPSFKDLKQVDIFISGRVQGVFFRSRAKSQAEKLGLTGWVKNLPDGRVEIVAVGEKVDLEKLIDWCSQGPLLAKVAKVDVKWQRSVNFFESFEIIY